MENKKLAEMPHPDGKGFGTWDINQVQEKRKVIANARTAGGTVHFGMIAELLPEGF